MATYQNGMIVTGMGMISGDKWMQMLQIRNGTENRSTAMQSILLKSVCLAM